MTLGRSGLAPSAIADLRESKPKSPGPRSCSGIPPFPSAPGRDSLARRGTWRPSGAAENANSGGGSRSRQPLPRQWSAAAGPLRKLQTGHRFIPRRVPGAHDSLAGILPSDGPPNPLGRVVSARSTNLAPRAGALLPSPRSTIPALEDGAFAARRATGDQGPTEPSERVRLAKRGVQRIPRENTRRDGCQRHPAEIHRSRRSRYRPP